MSWKKKVEKGIDKNRCNRAMTLPNGAKKKRKNTNDLRNGDHVNNGFAVVRHADYLFVRCNAKYVRVNFSELICIRGKRGYIQIVTETETFITLNKLNEIIACLPKHLFCRIHHSYIVAVSRIKAFDNAKVYLYGETGGKKFRPGLARARELPVGAHCRRNINESVRYLPSYVGRKSKGVKEAELDLAELVEN